MQLETLFEALIQGGPALAVLFMLYRGNFRFERELKEMEKDRDFWKSAALRSVAAVERSVGAVEQAAQNAKNVVQIVKADGRQ